MSEFLYEGASNENLDLKIFFLLFFVTSHHRSVIRVKVAVKGGTENSEPVVHFYLQLQI